MSYVLTQEAEEELAAAVAFCAQQFSVSVAENFLDTFEAQLRLIAEFPGVGTATSKGLQRAGLPVFARRIHGGG